MNEQLHEPHDLEASLNVAILSNPKTGNVWLTRLVRELYNLPLQPVDSSLVFLPVDDLEALGGDWLIFAHVHPVHKAARNIGLVLSRRRSKRSEVQR